MRILLQEKICNGVSMMYFLWHFGQANPFPLERSTVMFLLRPMLLLVCEIPCIFSTHFCQTTLQLPSRIIIIDNMQSNQTVLWQGVEWDVNPKKNKLCEDCLKGIKTCGYEISEPTIFLCYYPEASSKGIGTQTIWSCLALMLNAIL